MRYAITYSMLTGRGTQEADDEAAAVAMCEALRLAGGTVLAITDVTGKNHTLAELASALNEKARHDET